MWCMNHGICPSKRLNIIFEIPVMFIITGRQVIFVSGQSLMSSMTLSYSIHFFIKRRPSSSWYIQFLLDIILSRILLQGTNIKQRTMEFSLNSYTIHIYRMVCFQNRKRKHRENYFIRFWCHRKYLVDCYFFFYSLY